MTLKAKEYWCDECGSMHINTMDGKCPEKVIRITHQKIKEEPSEKSNIPIVESLLMKCEEESTYTTYLDTRQKNMVLKLMKDYGEIVRNRTTILIAEKARTKYEWVTEARPQSDPPVYGNYSQSLEPIVDKQSILDCEKDAKLEIL